MKKPVSAASLEESLRRFAEAHPIRTGPPCWVCGLPVEVLRAMESQRKAGKAYSTITRWLRAPIEGGGLGYPRDKATENKIQHHFREHVAK